MTKLPEEEQSHSRFRLTAEDARVVDELFAAGRKWSVPDGLTDPRAVRLAELFQLLEGDPAVVADDEAVEPGVVASATLAQIYCRQPADARFDQPSDPGRFPASLRFSLCENDHLNASARTLRINWREAISAAALILVTISVTIPMLGNARAQATRQACCSNMLGAAVGFSGYANDHNGEMPNIYDAIPEGNWLTTRANSANLFSLARGNYVTLETLACPWNPNAGTDPRLLQELNWPDRWSSSYSYQNQFGPRRPLWANPVGTTAVLSDRSPLVDACSPNKGGEPEYHDGEARSHCHDGERQSILLSDGRVVRNLKPFVGNDNIWLPRDYNRVSNIFIKYAGTEVPVDEFDSMLIQ